MMNFCTLFDSNYLDKGTALYRSLERNASDFRLYIFCFDDKSYEILTEMGLKYAVILHHSCFETRELLEKKETRSRAEYCWTCTSVIIEYVLDHYNVDDCTYIDSDLYFFHDPQVLFDEIADADADVTIVEHRFKDDAYGKKLEERNGKYCVEFNYFKNNSNARKVLTWWKDQCFEWCYDIPEKDRMGDQKYLNQFPILFEGIHELQHLGGGVAPWNLEQYRLEYHDSDTITLSDGNKDFPIVFYHFQNIRYMPGNKVNIKSQTNDKKLKYAVYIPYLKEIQDIREELSENYGLKLDNSGITRSSNKILGFLQRHFAAYKVRILSDVIRLDRLDMYN